MAKINIDDIAIDATTLNGESTYMVAKYNGEDNPNDITAPGCYRTGVQQGLPGHAWGQLLVVHGGSDTIGQMYFDYRDNSVFMRAGNIYSGGELDIKNAKWQKIQKTNDEVSTTSMSGTLKDSYMDISNLNGGGYNTLYYRRLRCYRSAERRAA